MQDTYLHNLSTTNDMFEKFVLDVGNGANQIVENGMAVIKHPEEICLDPITIDFNS